MSTYQNFSGDTAHETRVRAMLVDGEDLIAVIGSDQRLISLTTKRVILHERSGSFSVIRNSQISAVEVSKAGHSGMFVQLHFGGGLSRTISAPDEVMATLIAGAAGRG